MLHRYVLTFQQIITIILPLTYSAGQGQAGMAGLRIFSVESALIECSPQYFSRHDFSRHATDARAAMATVRDASGVLAKLLNGGHSTIAGRLAGAFRNSGRDRTANNSSGVGQSRF
jgi:hypothetical protein